jgi:transposase InsO family protein
VWFREEPLMPWQETDVRSERISLVVAAQQGEASMTALSRRHGVSRKTAYKWVRRHRELGSLWSLDEQSRRPHRSPEATNEAAIERVVALRQQYGWGGRKLQTLLAQEGIELSRSTVDRILQRKGLVSEEPRHRPAVQRFERAQPNELLQMDFKGEWRPARSVVHPLSVLDDHSRYVLVLAPLRTQDGDSVQPVLVRAFEEHGVPESMLIDHGTPWWSSTSGYGLTRLAVFLIRQGVRLLYSGFRHPQTQGKVERMHRTLEQWFGHHGLPSTWSGFVTALEEFRQEYNQVRPHEALGMATPATRYQPSPRRYQAEPPEWEYPPGCRVERLRNNGCLRLNGEDRFVCQALDGQRVGCDFFQQRVLVRYRHMLIREIDLITGETRPMVQPYGPTGH